MSAKAGLLKLVVVAGLAAAFAFGVVAFGFRAGHAPAAARAAKRSQPSAAASAALTAEPAAVPAAAVMKAAPAAPPAPPASLRSLDERATRPARRTRAASRAAPDAPRAHHVTQPTPASVTLSEPSTQADDSLGPELALLREARAALDRHDPRAALAILDRHAQRYPSGTLQQERLAARALALCALERTAEAATAAGELARVAPGSPYPARVPAGCRAKPSK